MKVICNDTFLDLDAINNFTPDGEQVYCQFDVATYKTDTLLEKEFGTFIKTEDNGVIYFSDLAFKYLFDLAVAAKLDNVKYLIREMQQGISHTEDKDNSLRRPNEKKMFGKMLVRHNIKNILLQNTDCVIEHNLKALSEYDMIHMLCTDAGYYTDHYKDVCFEMAEFLSDYLYLGKDVKSFMYLHKAFVELFCTFSSVDFKNFTEKFYGILDKFDGIKYTEKAAGTLGLKPDKAEPITSAGSDKHDVEESSENSNQNVPEKSNPVNVPENNNVNRSFARKLKMVSGADITGLDETYAAGYCEGLYDKEIENADSDGFLEKLIIARANEKAAPIDLLSEAITKEHEKDTPINRLRYNMSNIRENIEEAVEE